MKRKIGISCLLILLIIVGFRVKVYGAYNSDSYKQPLFELRGAWVATVSNIDITKQYGTSDKAINDYKTQYLKILSVLEQMKMNAVFFQVRPANDAFYPSEFNAWSMFLVGDGVNPGWDPLAWMVEETHKHGMEFHAWLNPYRVSAGTMTPGPSQTVEDMKYNYILSRQSQVEGQNIQNPLYRKVTKGSTAYNELMEQIVWGVSENKLFLNPARQTTIDFITDTIEEIITNYEVDGIHFDDYFYPSGGIETKIDNKDYQQYGSGFANQAAWRRDNVDRMVKAVHDAVEVFNANTTRTRKVQFGISPAAVWAPSVERCAGTGNASRGVEGGMDVACGNYSSYNDLNADTRKWVVEEWIDYILPQAYMTFESYYKPVVSWWAKTVRGTSVKLYVGLAPYRYLDSTPWQDEYQIATQIVYNNTLPEVSGTVFFSYKNLSYTANNYLNMARYYVKQLWKREALLPIYDTQASVPAISATNAFGCNTSTGHQLIFNETPNALGYVLYRFGLDEAINYTNDKIYQAIRQMDGVMRHTINIKDDINKEDNEYKYVLRTVDLKGTYFDNEEIYNSTEFPDNQAPVISDLVVGNGFNQIPRGQRTVVSFKVTDFESETILVKVSLYRGQNEEYTSQVNVTSGETYEYLWDAYLIDTDDLYFKILVSDGSESTEVSSEHFSTVTKYRAPTGYTIEEKDGKVIISGLTNAEYSLDGINYQESNELVAPSKEPFTVYIRYKAFNGLEAGSVAVETVGTAAPETNWLLIGLVGGASLVVIGTAVVIVLKKGRKADGIKEIQK